MINGVEKAIFVNGNPRLAEGVNGFNATIQRLDPLVAPISQGDIVGTLTVTFNGKEVAKTTC